MKMISINDSLQIAEIIIDTNFYFQPLRFHFSPGIIMNKSLMNTKYFWHK